ncbi:MAG: tetratricopeptide repeat protein [Candidatus Koribacter versatilis]|uniref:Tetratricopeptide repeat protein n=1 Tax=Candidatus Korobacter versatilis TaxID=658062 RepID=A0A932A746_9BACT|nr:tetratricopeptide repeat protein [Candidatus Koribacter versatilis]
MLGSLFGYGIILQVFAVIHWVRRRPDTFWLWIILIGGGLGALIYLVAEALPDLYLVAPTFKALGRGGRIRQMRTVILDNPAPGNYEELADLLRDDGEFAEAREAYDRAITSRTTNAHPFYGRALCALDLGDFSAAVGDLERVLAIDNNFDYGRAAGLYALALARSGQNERAAAAFEDSTRLSTLSETQYNYAVFLHMQGREPEARAWTGRILAKKATLPRYLKRRERPWFRKAAALLKELPNTEGAAAGK